MIKCSLMTQPIACECCRNVICEILPEPRKVGLDVDELAISTILVSATRESMKRYTEAVILPMIKRKLCCDTRIMIMYESGTALTYYIQAGKN